MMQHMLCFLLLIQFHSTLGLTKPLSSILNASYFINYNSSANTVLGRMTLAPSTPFTNLLSFAHNNQYFLYYVQLSDSSNNNQFINSSVINMYVYAYNQPATRFSSVTSNSIQSLVLEPSLPLFGAGCNTNGQCEFALYVENISKQNIDVQIGYFTGMLLNPNVLYQPSQPLQRGDYSLYGYYVYDSIMPVQFDVVESGSNSNTYMEQYLSTESNPFSYFVPSSTTPANTNNTIDSYSMSTSDPNYQSGELVLQIALASMDSGTQYNTYTVIESGTSGSSIQLFGLGLFALGGGLVVVGLCIISSLIVCYRRRRQSLLLAQWQRDHPNQPLPTSNTRARRNIRTAQHIDFGATDDEIEKYTKCTTFHHENIPTESQYNNTDTQPTCTICLAEYQEDEPLMLLACGHYYHQQCGANWLKRRKVCSLCLRPIDAVIVNHNNNNSNSTHIESPGISPMSTTVVDIESNNTLHDPHSQSNEIITNTPSIVHQQINNNNMNDTIPSVTIAVPQHTQIDSLGVSTSYDSTRY